MLRFFFDFRQGADRCADAEGTEFVSVEQAYLEAVKGAQDMWSELLRQRQDPRRCAFEVRDDQRQLLFVLPFEEVMDGCIDSPMPPPHDEADHAVRNSSRVSEEFIETLHAVRKTLEQSGDLMRIEAGIPPGLTSYRNR